MKTKIGILIRKWGFSVISIILGGIFILGILTFFNGRIEKTMEDSIHTRMNEANQYAIITLNSSFENFENLLEQQARIFGMLSETSDEKLMEELVNFSNKGGYKNAAIATFDGKIYSSFQGISEAEDTDVFPNLMKNETVISQPRIFHDNTVVIDISTPVNINGKNIGKLVVSLGSDYIAKMFSDDVLQGDAALNLIAQDGKVIARSSKRESFLTPGCNVFEFYRDNNMKFTEGSTEELARSMKSQRSTWIKFNDGKIETSVSFMPFGRNNWYIAIAATEDSLRAETNIIQGNVLWLTAGIMLIVVIASIIVIIQRVKEQKRLDNLKNTYSIAIRKTNDLFYEADIKNNEFIDYSEQKDKAIWSETPKNYSNALIQVAEVCAPECRQEFLDTFLPHNIEIKVKEGISSINFEYKIVPKDKPARWLSATFVPIQDGSGGIKLICMENDITERMLSQKMLEKSATLDGLSGLYNKLTTQTYIDHFFANEGHDGIHALVLVDIDRFKLINDTLGHAKGDEVISDFGAVLKKTFRKSDIEGRVGGDEFIILLKNCGTQERVEAKLKEMQKAFDREYFSEEDKSKVVRPSLSIGIAIYDKDGNNFDELYKAADIALYESKEQGRNRYTFVKTEK